MNACFSKANDSIVSSSASDALVGNIIFMILSTSLMDLNVRNTLREVEVTAAVVSDDDKKPAGGAGEGDWYYPWYNRALKFNDLPTAANCSATAGDRVWYHQDNILAPVTQASGFGGSKICDELGQLAVGAECPQVTCTRRTHRTVRLWWSYLGHRDLLWH